ncbi:MAG: hypothetical protein ACHQUC_00500 [Chlamydiales bacterium]
MAAVSPMGNFIREYYDVAFAGEGVDRENFENVDEFLLGNEESTVYYDIHALFINTFATKDDLVLMQNDNFDLELEKREFYSLLTTEAKKEGYAADTKALRTYTWIKRLVAESIVLQRAFYNAKSFDKKYRIAANLFAINSLMSIVNPMDSLIETSKLSMPEHQKSIIAHLDRVKLSARYTFLHVESNVMISPISVFNAQAGNDQNSQEKLVRKMRKIYPPELYIDFLRNLVNRKVVILTLKLEIVERIERPRLLKYITVVTVVANRYAIRDKKTLDLLNKSEYFQLYLAFFRAKERAMLSGFGFLADRRLRMVKDALAARV